MTAVKILKHFPATLKTGYLVVLERAARSTRAHSVLLKKNLAHSAKLNVHATRAELLVVLEATYVKYG